MVYWQRCLVVTWLVLRETAAVWAQVLCTPSNHAPVLRCHFIQSHIGRVHVCLAVTCHLCFWQTDRGVRATAVTLGWNGYQSKSCPWRRNFSRCSCQGLESGIFRSLVRRSNHWANSAHDDDNELRLFTVPHHRSLQVCTEQVPIVKDSKINVGTNSIKLCCNV